VSKLLEILVRNDKCEVKDIGTALWRIVTQRFTFKVPGAYFSPTFRAGHWNGEKNFFERNELMTGLLPILIEVLEQYEEPYSIIDKRPAAIELEAIDSSYSIGEKSLRDYQVDAVNSIINNKIGSMNFYRGILKMATNAGKTVTAQAIMNEILKKIQTDERILFIVPTKELLFQTIQNFNTAFPGIFVGTIGAGKWSEGTITVCLIPTLSKHIKEKKFKDFARSIRAIFIDEVQHASSVAYKKVLNQLDLTPIRIGLTGTLPDKEIEKHMVMGYTGTPTVNISNEYLISINASARPKCYFIEVKSPEPNDILDYAEEYSMCITNNPLRNKFIRIIAEKERKLLNSNILILVEHTEHGELLKDLLENSCALGTIEFTHGGRTTKVRKQILEDLKAGNINVLIATSVLDEGIDTDNINAIIYARGQKSPRKLLQGLGRGLRKKKDGSCLRFYDFLDFTGANLKKHNLDRYTVLKEEKFEIKMIDPMKKETWEEISNAED
jgi:superfamily II DNA or RNA helicase